MFTVGFVVVEVLCLSTNGFGHIINMCTTKVCCRIGFQVELSTQTQTPLVYLFV
ncbi:hypothetical protein HanRHA438_Chr02g0062381 [Helianthus annuus]|nr:hypothetical protein HanRHA438_Chr02g0062381 [Helianthus annuus]